MALKQLYKHNTRQPLFVVGRWFCWTLLDECSELFFSLFFSLWFLQWNLTMRNLRSENSMNLLTSLQIYRYDIIWKEIGTADEQIITAIIGWPGLCTQISSMVDLCWVHRIIRYSKCAVNALWSFSAKFIECFARHNICWMQCNAMQCLHQIYYIHIGNCNILNANRWRFQSQMLVW